MADIIDRAQIEIERELAWSLAKIRRMDGISMAVCMECGNDIPKLRQQLLPGVTRCVGCQEFHEKTKRLYISQGK